MNTPLRDARRLWIPPAPAWPAGTFSLGGAGRGRTVARFPLAPEDRRQLNQRGLWDAHAPAVSVERKVSEVAPANVSALAAERTPHTGSEAAPVNAHVRIPVERKAHTGSEAAPVNAHARIPVERKAHTGSEAHIVSEALRVPSQPITKIIEDNAVVPGNPDHPSTDGRGRALPPSLAGNGVRSLTSTDDVEIKNVQSKPDGGSSDLVLSTPVKPCRSSTPSSAAIVVDPETSDAGRAATFEACEVKGSPVRAKRTRRLPDIDEAPSGKRIRVVLGPDTSSERDAFDWWPGEETEAPGQIQADGVQHLSASCAEFLQCKSALRVSTEGAANEDDWMLSLSMPNGFESVVFVRPGCSLQSVLRVLRRQVDAPGGCTCGHKVCADAEPVILQRQRSGLDLISAIEWTDADVGDGSAGTVWFRSRTTGRLLPSPAPSSSLSI